MIIGLSARTFSKMMMGYQRYCWLLLIVLLRSVTGQDLITEANPVNETQDFVFNCTSPSGIVQISRTVNGEETGALASRIQTTTLTQFFAVYTFPNVMREDDGLVFVCLLLVGGNDVESGRATLIVNFSPEYTDDPQSPCIKEGEDFSLALNLEAQPVVDSFSWTKDGVAYQGDVSAASFNISNAALGDAGVYNVTASNFLGSDSYSFTLSVTRPPVFGSIPQMQNVFVGDDYVVNCTVIDSFPSNPTIKLTTPDGNETITSSPVYPVTNIQMSFNYICIADNSKSVSTLTFVVTVLQRPTPTISIPGPSTASSSPTIITSVTPQNSIAIIIGVVVGVSVLACVISILVPLLICCCLGVACFASIGCLAKNKKYDEAELKGVKL